MIKIIYMFDLQDTKVLYIVDTDGLNKILILNPRYSINQSKTDDNYLALETIKGTNCVMFYINQYIFSGTYSIVPSELDERTVKMMAKYMIESKYV